MLRRSGESTQPAVFVGHKGRRRRAFSAVLVTITLGWIAVIVLVIVGMTMPPSAVPAGKPAHRPAVAATHGAHSASKTSSVRMSETSSKITHWPPACSTGSKCATRGCLRSRLTLAAISFGSVNEALNADGVAPPGQPSAGNFDCRGFSFQAQQLAAAGFGPGDTVAAAGHMLTLPDVAGGAPDEIVADGQVIHLNPADQRASELGFLGAGEFGTQSGLVTITYVGGSTQKAMLRLADWYADSPAPGGVIAASALWNVPAAHASSLGSATVSVYYTQIPVDASKRIASVTLPKNADLHLFDIGVPKAARYRSVSSAYNDTALAPASAARDGNFDGAGHSYDSSAFPASGLKPGASVTAQGVRFTWPHYAAGHFDNIRAEGQTIDVPGTGRVLGFLGAGVLGTQFCTVTIHYTDGSSKSVTLGFADWLANRAVSGGTAVATVPWNLVPGARPHQVSVYSATVPLEAGKTVASVTLPVDVNMHVFAIAEGS